MKYFYTIIIALGCLISSGTYGMEHVSELRPDKEVQRDLYRLMLLSPRVETVRSCFENPTVNTQDNLAFCLAVAKGVQCAAHDAKNSTSGGWHAVAALAKGTGMFLFNPVLGAIVAASAAGDVLQSLHQLTTAEKHENISRIIQYLSNQKGANIPWFDEESECLMRARRLIEESNSQELERCLRQHGNEPSIQANIFNLQLLSTTKEASERLSMKFPLSCASLASGVGTVVALFAPHQEEFRAAQLTYANGGPMQIPRAYTNVQHNFTKDPAAVVRTLNALRSRIPNTEITQAQDQIKETLQHQLDQAEKEREEAKEKLERGLEELRAAPLPGRVAALERQIVELQARQ